MSLNLLKQIIANPIPYAHALGYDLLKEGLHDKWIRQVFFQTEDFTTQAHRDSFKTTCLGIGLGLRIFARPQKNVVFFRKDETATKEVIRAVKKDLQSDIVNRIVRNIYGKPLKFTIDGANELETNLYNGPKECQLMGKGIRSGVTGLHGDVITDDIITLKDRLSTAEREYVKNFYQELKNVAGRVGKRGNFGTPWHKDDAFTKMPAPNKYTIYDTGIFSEQEIKATKEEMTDSLFAANYELKHIADGDQLFIEPQYGPFPIGAKAYAQIDAAYGGEDASSLTIIAERDGKLHTVGWKMPGHVENHYNEIISRLQRFQAVECWLENNADKGFLQKELSQRHNISFRGYHEAMNKYYKISTYGRKEWNRAIIDLEESDLEYIGEIMDYNENAEHDDCPDSFASLVRAKFQQKKEISFHRR